MGLHFATAQNIFGSNEFYNAQYKVADSAETRIFKVTLSAITGDAPTFDSCDASTEISIGEIKFRKDTRDNLYGNDGLGYIFKAKDGKEYAIGIYPTTDFENFADVATEYFNKVVLAK